MNWWFLAAQLVGLFLCFCLLVWSIEEWIKHIHKECQK